MRIAVMIKQVPRFESMALGSDGRLVRDGIELEMNPYCRRAVSKGVELARSTGGACTAVTLGPPAAEDALREAVAWGADEGLLIGDQAFAGSDTLATARALAAALAREGPWDLVLAGRNSVDADTGQVGPEVAQLLGLPFLGGVRRLVVSGRSVHAHLEHDDGWADAEIQLPAVLTCAERLCEPAKVGPEGRAAVPAGRIRRLSAADLGQGPWGQAASPTSVGEIRVLNVERDRVVLSGPLGGQVARAVELLADSGALGRHAPAGDPDPAVDPVVGAVDPAVDVVADGWSRGSAVVAVLIQPDRAALARELLGAAARLARAIGAAVVAVEPATTLASDLAGRWGADAMLSIIGAEVEEDVARAVAEWARDVRPWAVLAPGTMWGREVAARVAASLGAGLTGDAVDLAVDAGRLVAWKPAFGGRLVAAITATSPVQLATVRPGMLARLAPRAGRPVPQREVAVEPGRRLRILAAGRQDDIGGLAVAEAVVGVGTAVGPDEYPALGRLLAALGAELAATRKVTDRGWQPRSRQVGITGRSISPRLYVAIGLSGKFNHMVGVLGAGKILAINHDPDAPVFDSADIGIVADWHRALPPLVTALEAAATLSAGRRR